MYLWRSASLVCVSPRETGPAARSVGVSGLPADVQDSSEYIIILEKGDKFLVLVGDVAQGKDFEKW